MGPFWDTKGKMVKLKRCFMDLANSSHPKRQNPKLQPVARGVTFFSSHIFLGFYPNTMSHFHKKSMQLWSRFDNMMFLSFITLNSQNIKKYIGSLNHTSFSRSIFKEMLLVRKCQICQYLGFTREILLCYKVNSITYLVKNSI